MNNLVCTAWRGVTVWKEDRKHWSRFWAAHNFAILQKYIQYCIHADLYPYSSSNAGRHWRLQTGMKSKIPDYQLAQKYNLLAQKYNIKKYNIQKANLPKNLFWNTMIGVNSWHKLSSRIGKKIAFQHILSAKKNPKGEGTSPSLTVDHSLRTAFTLHWQSTTAATQKPLAGTLHMCRLVLACRPSLMNLILHFNCILGISMCKITQNCKNK